MYTQTMGRQNYDLTNYGLTLISHPPYNSTCPHPIQELWVIIHA